MRGAFFSWWDMWEEDRLDRLEADMWLLENRYEKKEAFIEKALAKEAAKLDAEIAVAQSRVERSDREVLEDSLGLMSADIGNGVGIEAFQDTFGRNCPRRHCLRRTMKCSRRALLEALCTSLDEMSRDTLAQLAGKVQHFGECSVCMEKTDVLLLECQHGFCEECMSGQLHARWPGPRVTFGYLNCALCRVPLAHDMLSRTLTGHNALREEVVSMAEKKFREDLLDHELAEHTGKIPTVAEVREKAAEDLTVFMCYDCGKPYCGGRVGCVEQQDLQANQLRCQECEFTAKALGKRCMVHGHKTAMFKCDSCCAIAVWNCTMHHYCERCHNQAYADKDFPCPGPELCPLGIPHPPNVPANMGNGDGTFPSFVIGCMACFGGAADINQYLGFSGANEFGYPERDWQSFDNAQHVLDALGGVEIRDRLEVLHLSAQGNDLDCAERLLAHEQDVPPLLDA